MKRFDEGIISGRSLAGHAHGNALFPCGSYLDECTLTDEWMLNIGITGRKMTKCTFLEYAWFPYYRF